MRLRFPPTAVVVALALLTGCSSGTAEESRSGEGPAPATVPAGEARALTRAVRAYVDAYFGNDAPTALAAMSERCRGVLSHEAEHADRQGEDAYALAVREIADRHGPREATGVTVDELDGDRARVSYRVEGLPEFDQQGQPWLRERGAWKYDAC